MTKKEQIQKIKEEIKKLEKRDFNVYFFVLDTKGNPSGELNYIYQTALCLDKFGYKVTMLHQEENFVGVKEWLGEKYASLKHKNVEKENVDVSPSDFLFIPEIYANVMAQTKSLPCKKIMLYCNERYLTSTIPVGVTWEDLRVYDVITTTEENAKTIRNFFPEMRIQVVNPSISPLFRNNEDNKELVINVISRDQSDVDKIVKPFYWKYPIYKWISFRDIRGLSQEGLSETLGKGAITIWIDDDTSFGYTFLEALKCGSIVLAKVPETPQDWMLNSDGDLIEGPLWFTNTKELPSMIASVIRSWTWDNIPQEIYDNNEIHSNIYFEDEQEKQIKKVYCDGLFLTRIEELDKAIAILKQENNNENQTENE